MDKLLMLGSCKGGKEILDEARRRDIYTIIADNCEIEESRFRVQADERWMVDTSEIDLLERKCRENRVTAVINAISTFNVGVAMELSKRLNLPCYCAPSAWNYTINKFDFKELCRNNGVPVAQEYTAGNLSTGGVFSNIDYPVVVKAVDQSANRGMSYCYSKEELIPAIKLAQSVSKSDRVIIERMLDGIEYGAHNALADGKASMFAFVSMLSQPGEPGNCYSITTTVANHLDKYLREIDPFFQKALSSGGMREGVAWIEMILDRDGHFYVLEMGYRMSGDMMAIPLKNVTGFDSYQWLLDISMGIQHTEADLPKSQTALYRRSGCSYILWSKEAGEISSIIGIPAVKEKHPEVQIIYDVHEGDRCRKNQYLITFVFDSADVYGMCNTIRNINEKVRILNDKGDSIAIYYDDFDAISSMLDEATDNAPVNR